MRLIFDDISKWRPLGNPAEEPSIGKPRLLIWHTMVGFLRSTETMFKKNGFQGTESTWGLGGPWDGDALDGELWQWQRIDRQADANWDANVFGNSVECSDGGNPDRPLSDKQVEKSIVLGVEWCLETGNPATPAKTWDGRGFGYHSMYIQWNKSRHGCPNPTRIKQLRTVIWPEIARRVEAKTGTTNPPPAGGGGLVSSPAPKFPLPQGWYFGPKTGPKESVSGYFSYRVQLRRWQRQMQDRGWKIEDDGLYGPDTRDIAKKFQKEKKLPQQKGLIDVHTWNAAWTAKIT